MSGFTLSRSQVRELDRRAWAEYGIPGIVLMENAGRGCAELLMQLNPERLPTRILCGPGNNGGDGFVIARHLDNAGWPVTIGLFASADAITGDARINFETARLSGLMIEPDTVGLPEKGWVVDALFGTGLSRPLATPYVELVEQVNASKAQVFAVDLPSGLDCDTGEPLGATIRAHHTATFVANKRGFENLTSQAYTGTIHIIDIGAPRILVDQYRTSGR